MLPAITTLGLLRMLIEEIRCGHCLKRRSAEFPPHFRSEKGHPSAALFVHHFFGSA
jgi:hypothetical protein